MSVYGPLLNDLVIADAVKLSGEPAACEDMRTSVGVRSRRGAADFALQDRTCHAYNEAAFQYFVENERKRSELSNRPFVLMLIDFKQSGTQHPIDPFVAEKLFDVLSLSLRETDFTGWYREGRVAGAVLTQDGETDDETLSEVVQARIGAALREKIDADLAERLQIRVYQLPRNLRARNE
jgi:GGDEF domain-containing protein